MATYNSAQFKKQIKSGTFSPVYYIYGNDPQRVTDCTKFLLKKILGDNYEMYIQRYDGAEKNVDLFEISEAMDIFPFGCDYNVILLNNWNAEKRKADENKVMNALLKDSLNDSTILIFSISAFDVVEGKAKIAAKNKNKKIIDAVDKYGTVAVCNILTDKEMATEIIDMAKRQSCTISPADAIKIAQDCLCDSAIIKNEVDKLCAYTGNGKIERETIDKLVHKTESAKIYELSTAMLNGNTNHALHIYNILLDEIEPDAVIYMLSDNYINLYRAATGERNRVNSSQIADDFGYRFAFIVQNAVRDSKKFTITALRKCLVLLRDAQIKMNSTTGMDKKLYVEELIVKLISIQKASKSNRIF